MDHDRAKAKAAVAKMKKKEKVKYYIGYYKFHVIVVAIIGFVAAWLIHDIITSTESILGIGIINGRNIQEADLIEELNDYLYVGEKQTIKMYKDLSTDRAYNNGYYNMLDMYLASGELNISFADESGVVYLGKMGACIDVNNVLPEILADLWNDRLCSFEVLVDGSGFDENSVYESLPVAIDIEGTNLMKKLELDEKCHYLVVTSTEKCEEEIQNFFEYIYLNET